MEVPQKKQKSTPKKFNSLVDNNLSTMQDLTASIFARNQTLFPLEDYAETGCQKHRLWGGRF